MANMDPKADGDPAPAPRAVPDWKKGKFQLAFISMGQGDCCLVTCPNGQHILIDCGSKSFEAEGMPWAWALLRGPWCLNRPGTQQMRLSAVILTHPDKDHINKITYMLGHSTDGPAIPVSEVYFSDVKTTRTDYKSGPLSPYRSGGCGDTLIDVCGVKTLYRVTLRAGLQSLHSWKRPFGLEQFVTEDDAIGDHGVNVASGEFPDPADDDDDDVERLDWEVTIIAGNVIRDPANDRSDTNGRNAASLVTLVSIGDEKALICGDATQSTQAYLYNTFKNTDHIKNLEVLHVPHHGSSHTSATGEFIEHVQPKRVVITVKSNEHTHHLPGASVIDAYHKYATAAAKQHATRGWKRVNDAAFQKLRSIWEEEKGKTIQYEESAKTGRRRYTRTDLKDGDGFKGPVILDGVGAPNGAVKYVLYQRQTDREIRQTGYDENIWYYLPN